MPDELSAEDRAMIEEVKRRRLQDKDKKAIPGEAVKRFRQALTAEFNETGELKRETVERLLNQLKAGEL